MKIQKINSEKAIIVLSQNELSERKITIQDLKEGKKKAQDFFFKILQEAQLLDDFESDASTLLIEISEIDNSFMITITKAEKMVKSDTLSKIKNITNIAYTVSSNLYEFNCLKDLYAFSLKAVSEKLYLGNNALYEIDGNYYLLFTNASIKKSDFIKTFCVLSEYANKYYSKKDSVFIEYANCIIERNAIQYLQNL